MVGSPWGQSLVWQDGLWAYPYASPCLERGLGDARSAEACGRLLPAGAVQRDRRGCSWLRSAVCSGPDDAPTAPLSSLMSKGAPMATLEVTTCTGDAVALESAPLAAFQALLRG